MTAAEQRKAARITALRRCGDLLPGQSATFELPSDQPAKRDMAQAIGKAARSVLGQGRYATTTAGNSFIITRKESVL